VGPRTRAWRCSARGVFGAVGAIEARRGGGESPDAYPESPFSAARAGEGGDERAAPGRSRAPRVVREASPEDECGLAAAGPRVEGSRPQERKITEGSELRGCLRWGCRPLAALRGQHRSPRPVAPPSVQVLADATKVCPDCAETVKGGRACVSLLRGSVRCIVTARNRPGTRGDSPTGQGQDLRVTRVAPPRFRVDATQGLAHRRPVRAVQPMEAV
jgi:hypothetical protein